MILSNVYLWFHILAGGFGARVLSLFLKAKTAFYTVLGIAVSWEIIEIFIDGTSRTYGTVFRWAMDSTGDILGAVVMAAIVLWPWRQ